MSEEGDLLSQWRAYADNGAGVSIGFTKEYFEELGNLKRDRSDEFNASLQKIEYEITKQKEIVAEHLDLILKFVSEGALRRPSLLTSEEEAKIWREKFHAMGLRFIFFFFLSIHFKKSCVRRRARMENNLTSHSRSEN
jgi:hypothetical protein